MSDRTERTKPAKDAKPADAEPLEARSTQVDLEGATPLAGDEDGIEATGGEEAGASETDGTGPKDSGTIPFPETGASAKAASEDLAAEYLDRLQRLQAEFDNYRKRIQREKEAWRRQTKIGVLRELLPVLDDVNRARGHMETSKATPDGEGLMFILKKFADVLSQLGLEEMPTKPGTEFDPERHEALLNSPSDEIEEGGVVSTLEPGFIFEGEIVRPGKVLVSSGPATD